MSDFNSSLPIRTENNGDVVAKLADATIPSQQLAIDSSGNASVKVKNGSADPAAVEVIVSGSAVDPRDIRALTSGDVVTADQGSAAALSGAWPVKPTDGTNSQSYTAGGEALVSINQPLPSGTNHIGEVDSRLYDANGNAIEQGQQLMTVSLPVAIASDQSAFPINLQDGSGNAISSSGGHLDVKVADSLPAGSNNIGIVDSNLRDGSGNSISSTGGHLDVNIADPLPAGSNAIGSVLADLRVASNPVTASNPVPVTVVSSTPGTPVLDYKTSAALASAASVNLDYTVTAGKTLSLAGVFGSASGKMKLELKIETGVSTGVFNTKYVGFNSTANPNIDIWRNPFFDVAAGVRVRATITNLDNQSQDVYLTLEGNEY